ncbi:hypothetical protein BC828DRAFT_398129 [Blastocladiella britannica]|nr:hypothetical protein BC828DRAFT_398129 [Blastocladiella britannica]
MPWVGTAPKLTVIAGEADLGSLMGTPTFAMAAQAYPSQVSLHYRVKQPNSTVDPAATAANVTYGRMDADYVTSLLAPLAGRPDTMVVICGPQRFIDEAYGWACGIIGEDRVQILPPSTPLTNPEQTLVVPKGSGLPVAVHRDLQTGLGNWLYFKPRRA